MPATGGDITEISFNHPELGSGTFFPKANEDNTYDLGGFRNDDDQDMVDGSGAVIRKKTRKGWFVEATIAGNLNSTNNANASSDIELLNKLCASTLESDWTVTHISGTVWRGKGAPVGDIQENVNQGTIGFKVSGGGIMKKIVG